MLPRIVLIAAVTTALVGCYDMTKSSFRDAGTDDSGVPDEPCGELEWVAWAGGWGEDFILSIDTTANGEALLAGQLRDELTFGNTSANENQFSGLGCHDGFLAAYTPAGEVDWVEIIRGDGHQELSQVEVTPQGEIAVAGWFNHDFVLGGDGEPEITMIANPIGDSFVALYDADAALSWATHLSSSGEVVVSDIAHSTAAGGSIAVTGEFGGTLELDGGVIVLEHLSESSNAAFVALYDTDGALLWAVQSQGCASSVGIGAPNDGTLIVAGTFTDMITLGSGEQLVELTSDGEDDVFVARFDDQGALEWAQSAGGVTADSASALAARGDGTFVVIGQFTGTARFGPEGDQQNLTVLGAQDRSDTFVARYLWTGNLDWVRQADMNAKAAEPDIAFLDDGRLVATGGFAGSATWGPGEDGETSIQSLGGHDVFVALFEPTGELVCARGEGGAGFRNMATSTAATGSTGFVAGEFEDQLTFGPGEEGETSLTSIGDVDLFLARYSFAND
jgi:hypothetical protein